LEIKRWQDSVLLDEDRWECGFGSIKKLTVRNGKGLEKAEGDSEETASSYEARPEPGDSIDS
jgi:hypothetical protein